MLVNYKHIDDLLETRRPEVALRELLEYQQQAELPSDFQYLYARCLYSLGRLREAFEAAQLAANALPRRSELRPRARLLVAQLRANVEMEIDPSLKEVKKLLRSALNSKKQNHKLAAECNETMMKLAGLGLAFGLLPRDFVIAILAQSQEQSDQEATPSGSEVRGNLAQMLGAEFRTFARSELERAYLAEDPLLHADAALRLARFSLGEEVQSADRPRALAEALAYLHEARALFHQKESKIGEAETLVAEGLVRAKLGSDGRQFLLKALHRCEQLGFMSGAYEAASALAELLYSEGKSNESFHYRSRALSIALQMGFVAGTAFSRLSLASLAQQRDLLQVAWNEFKELGELAKRPTIKLLIGAAIAQGIATLPGQLEQAIELTEETAKLQNKLGRKNELRLTLSILGVLQMQALRWRESAKTWSHVSVLDQEADDSLSALEHHAFELQAGFMELCREKPLAPGSAPVVHTLENLASLRRKIAKQQSPRVPLVTASILQVEGQLSVTIEDPVPALKAFSEALHIYQKLNLPVQMAHAGTLVGLACQLLEKKGLGKMAEEASWHLSAAADAFEQAGMLALARHARSLSPGTSAINTELSIGKKAANSRRVVLH